MRVTFRAQFKGPIGKLNPSNWKIPNPAPMTVEVFRRGTKAPITWHARECDTRRKIELAALGSGPTHGTMKDTVAAAFQAQVSPWALYDTDGNPLDPDLIEETPDGEFQRKVVTHVGATPQPDTLPVNSWQTYCGIIVKAHEIRGKRGDVAPLCPECRKEYDRYKQEHAKK